MGGPGNGGFGNPFNKIPGYPSMEVGGKRMYPDNEGFLHPTPGEAISVNQRLEENFNHVTGGNCGQDPSKARG